MTTTLRPAEADGETNADAGGSAFRCRYDICDNGRRVGGVEVGAEDVNGVRIGRMAALEVQEPDRRRGRATVAVLAAEEVLRRWGCTHLRVAVPVDAEAALGLAAALGFTERSRVLVKDLTGPPEEVPGSDEPLAPAASAEFLAWRERELARIASGLLADGVPPEKASEAAERRLTRLLPEGPGTPEATFRVLRRQGTPIGLFGLSANEAPYDAAQAWLYGVEVAEEHRGRGHGRRLVSAAEELCRGAGRRVLGVRVWAADAAARGLYASMGYRVAEHRLGKRLL